MFFRFAAGLILVVLVSMCGIMLEKQLLEMKRTVSRQYFQVDMLLEMHASLRLSIQRQTAPAQMAALNASSFTGQQPTSSPATRSQSDAPSVAPLPLLRWQMPAQSKRD